MFEKISALLAKQLRIDADRITMDAAIFDDLGADSLDVVELMIAIEKETGVYISDDDAADMRTVGDVVNFCEAHKA